MAVTSPDGFPPLKVFDGGLDDEDQAEVLQELALFVGALGLAPHSDDVVVLVDGDLKVGNDSSAKR